MSSEARFTEMLDAVSKGDDSARDQLMAVVYDELRRLAGRYMQQERSNHTLQPTALVHEAYLRLVGQENVRWQNREHFIGVAALMMRRILVNYAISHKRHKRGGNEVKLSFSETDSQVNQRDVDLIALDQAMEKMAKSFPQESKVVELRYFGGLTIDETARVLGVSDSTVESAWRFARVWLQRELG